MAQARSKARFYATLASACLALLIGAGALLSRGPDRELSFVREVPVEATPAQLNQAMWAIINWPQWFHNLADARRVDLAGRPYPQGDQVLAKGALIELKVDPNKGPHKKFDMLVEVAEYVPERKIELKILRTSNGKLKRMFSSLVWRVEILPAEDTRPLRVRGTALGLTNSWRARLLGRIAERILMHQAYYPDVIKLGALTRPELPNPRPVYEQ